MKVLHLISGGDSGGAKTHVLSLLKDLNESITADLVCYMEGAFSREARALGIPVTVIDGGFRAGLRGTRELIKSGGYDVVHCHGSRANLTGAILKKGFDIPFISTVHSDYKLDYLGRPLANLTYGSMNRLALHAMDYRVCVSDQMRETLIARGFDLNDLFAIYNGVDFSRPKPNISRAGWLEKIGCDFADDTVIVGIGARLDPVKDVATTVRGFAEAAAQCDTLRLLIAGDGQEMETLKALAKELGLSGIRVNSVAPGVIMTDMNSALSEDDLKALADETPLGRIGEPDEVAKAIYFLASDESSFITGQTLSVDGGFVI